MPRPRTLPRLSVLAVVILTAVLLLALAAPALAFPDVPAGHPYETAINALSSAGIIGGYANGNFGLTDPVKRAQFAKMIVGTLLIDPPISTATRFTDLGTPDANGYPHRYVQAAYENGITYGTNATQTLFDPWKSIRRDQVVSMIVRGANSLVPGALSDPPAGTTSVFDGVPEPHGQNLRIAEYNGLLDGLVGMGPQWDVSATATRGEVAQMLYNLVNVLNSTTSGGDVWVNADGSGDYPTLEAAIAAVKPGTTINLGPGTFTLSDTLSINFDCNLVGSGTEGSSGTTVRCAGLVADVHDCSFAAQDIRFVNTSTSEACDVMDADSVNLQLQDCYFSGANRPADKGGDGLYIYGDSSAVVSGCVFTGNDLNGVDVDDDSGVTLEDSECSDNGQDGVIFWSTSTGQVTGNTLSGNTDVGLMALDNSDVAADQNTCSDNGDSGIGFAGDAQGSASDNTCSTNHYDGITCHDNSEVTLEHNTCQHNGEDGITLDDYCTGTVRYNTCSYSASYDGIDLEGHASGLIQNNTCANNHEAGIRFGGSSNGSASGNECTSNEYGIAVEPGANPTLGTNNLHGNTYDLFRFTTP